MRCTQYIGLIGDAKKFVASLQEVDSSNYTLGMFSEKIPLGCWKITGTNKIIKEVVQTQTWSSGMMIFTCLQIEEKEKPTKLRFKWVQDPVVRGLEFDYEKGLYYV